MFANKIDDFRDLDVFIEGDEAKSQERPNVLVSTRASALHCILQIGYARIKKKNDYQNETHYFPSKRFSLVDLVIFDKWRA